MVNDNQPPIIELAASAKLLFKLLEYQGPQTQKQLIEESWLCARTVRYALDRLKEADLVTENVYLPDARQSLYDLTTDARSKHGVADGGEMTATDEPSSHEAISSDDACCSD